MFQRSLPTYLIEDLQSDQKEKRLEAIKQITVRKASNDEALVLLQQLAEKDSEDEVRVEALTCLTVLLNSEALEHCLKAFNDNSPAVRKAAIALLRDLKIRKVHVHLTELLFNDPMAEVRAEAINTLVELRSERSFLTLLKLLFSDQPGVIKDLTREHITKLAGEFPAEFFGTLTETKEVNFLKRLRKEKEAREVVYLTSNIFTDKIPRLFDTKSLLARNIITTVTRVAELYPEDKQLGEISTELEKSWRVHVEKQQAVIKERLSYVKITPSRLEVFAGAVEKIRISFPVIKLNAAVISKNIGKILEITPRLPAEVEAITLTIDFNPFQGQEQELDAEVLLEILVEENSTMMLPLSFPVKIHGWEELDPYAKKLLELNQQKKKLT
ncbi:MAG: HEAT repeat domain-containing protein, partial [Candidatus Odinarchaeota archaeon]